MADTPAEYTQARIRVNQRGALVTRIALERYDEFIRDARAIAEDKLPFNRQLADVRRVIAEVERTIEEQGWDDVEPERAHEG